MKKVLSLLLCVCVLLSSAFVAVNAVNEKIQPSLTEKIAQDNNALISVSIDLQLKFNKSEIEKYVLKNYEGADKDADLFLKSYREEVVKTISPQVQKFVDDNNEYLEKIKFQGDSIGLVIADVYAYNVEKIAQYDLVSEINYWNDTIQISEASKYLYKEEFIKTFDAENAPESDISYDELYYHKNANNEVDWVLIYGWIGVPAEVETSVVVGNRIINSGGLFTPFEVGYGVYDVNEKKFYDIKDYKSVPNKLDELESVLTELNIGTEDTEPTEPKANGKIYFDTSGWKNFNRIYFYIMEKDGAYLNELNNWPGSKCVKETDNLYYYDFSNSSFTLSDSKDYIIKFSADTGVMTYDITFGTECIGDTLKMTGVMLEEPIDSSKQTFDAVWLKNNDEYGSHIAVSTSGNVFGKYTTNSETKEMILVDWLVKNYEVNPNFGEIIPALFVKLGINTDEKVGNCISYLKSYYVGEDTEKLSNSLKEAFSKAYIPAAMSPKKANTIKVTAKTKTVKAKKLKSKKQTVKPLTVKNAKGAVKVTKVKSGTTARIYKKVTVNSKTGAVTFNKGKYAKKTYTIKLKITAKGNLNYKSKTLTKTVKIRVK